MSLVLLKCSRLTSEPRNLVINDPSKFRMAAASVSMQVPSTEHRNERSRHSCSKNVLHVRVHWHVSVQKTFYRSAWHASVPWTFYGLVYSHNFALLCALVMDLMPSLILSALIRSWHLRVDFRAQRRYATNVAHGSMLTERSVDTKFVLHGSMADLKHVCEDRSNVFGSTLVSLRLLLSFVRCPDEKKNRKKHS